MTQPFAADPFEARRRGFEEEYFKTKDAQLVAKLKSVFLRKLNKEDLRKTAGITDEALLNRLVDISLNGEMLTAFKLYPLVEIAWADGAVDEREVEAVIKAAEKFGVAPDSVALARLRDRLRTGPDNEVRAAWRMYAQELRKTLSAQELTAFRNDLLSYANKVARASGGVFGDALAISPGEKRAIKAITDALT